MDMTKLFFEIWGMMPVTIVQALRDAADTRGERSLAKLKILRKVLEPLLRTTEDKDMVLEERRVLQG